MFLMLSRSFDLENTSPLLSVSWRWTSGSGRSVTPASLIVPTLNCGPSTRPERGPREPGAAVGRERALDRRLGDDRAHGYLDRTVSEPRPPDDRESARLTISFAVPGGPHVRVGGLDLAGVVIELDDPL